jgi:hypothetical protein
MSHFQSFKVVDLGSAAIAGNLRYTVEAIERHSTDSSRAATTHIASCYTRETADMIVAGLNGSAPKLLASLQSMIEASDNLTGSIEGSTDQFDIEKGALMDATSAAEKLVEAVNAGTATATASDDLPRVVLTIEGGLVSDVLATVPIECLTIDYDTEGADVTDLSKVPQGNGAFADAFAVIRSTNIDPERVGELFGAVEGK